MKHRIEKSFRFESAHRLPHLPDDHKCSRLHGHSFKVTLVLEGPLQPQGWIMDAGEVSAQFKPILQTLDHYYLNDIPGLENPTSEVLAQWIYLKTKPKIEPLVEVRIDETCTLSAIYCQ